MIKNEETANKRDDGTYVKDGVTYNRYGICLDCNGGSTECKHQNLGEHEGKVVCNTCGLAV